MGTILAGHGIADIVVVLRTMPSGDAVTAITQKLMEGLREADHSKTYSSSRTERGFDILSSEAAVRILISTVESNIAILNPSLHRKLTCIVDGWLTAASRPVFFAVDGSAAVSDMHIDCY